MLSLYNYKDYKKYLRDTISSTLNSRGLMKKWAESANCHPSYLTQALKTHVQLTQDHAVGIAESLNLSEFERDYFLLLVDHARSGTPALRKIIDKKLQEIKSKQEKVSERLRREKAQDEENLALYYSSWHYAFIHILVSIPEFQTVEKIADRIHLKKDSVMSYLRALERMGLVLNQQSLWKHSGRQLHVPEDSQLVHLHHNNWRQQAVLDSQTKAPDSVHFSGVYSISKTDFDQIKNVVLKALESINAKASESGTEEVIIFCCDLFRQDR